MTAHAPKEVHVRTRDQLQAALRRAERIVVEGDASLAAYATTLANAGRRQAPDRGQTILRPIASDDRAAHVAVGGRAPRLWPWIAGAGALIAATAAAVLLEHFSRVTGTLAAHPGLPAQPVAPAAQVANPSLLLWPAASIALILVLFFVARRLTAARPAHAPAWHVAEAAQGRVVIARDAAHRHPHAA